MKTNHDELDEALCGLSLYANLPPLYAPGDTIIAFSDGLDQPMTGRIILHAQDDRGQLFYIIKAVAGGGNYIVAPARVSI